MKREKCKREIRMASEKYTKYIYKVVGENIKKNPETIFDPQEVYLIIDKNMSLIWIWAGAKSRLFHRYIASSWAGKLKSKKPFYNFNYELIKQGREPEEFKVIVSEIDEGRMDLDYPGESRKLKIEGKKISLDKVNSKISKEHISNKKISTIKSILSEIKEMQMHIQYSMQHIQKRINKINTILDT
jgi:hypothetical protein